jgi:hypothetical protein
LAWLCKDRSVPRGRYWRSNLLVFSFEPRCQMQQRRHFYTLDPLKNVWPKRRGVSVSKQSRFDLAPPATT